MADPSLRVRTPLIRTYSEVRHLMRVFEGRTRKSILQMMADIRDQTGTPQDPVDWSEPDTWISERLAGESAQIARSIWEQSERSMNPRYTYGGYFFVQHHRLMNEEADGTYRLTDKGRRFLEHDEVTVRELDEIEGVSQLLTILAPKTRAMRGELLPEWRAFLAERSKFGTPSTTKDTLRRRMVLLIDRGLVDRDGNAYCKLPGSSPTRK